MRNYAVFYNDISEALALLVFSQIRLMKISGVLGPPHTCGGCGKDLGDILEWQLPQMFFACENCALTANKEQAAMAQVVSLAYKQRFLSFHLALKEKTQQNAKPQLAFLLSLWKNLNLCLEDFFDLKSKVFVQIEKQLQENLQPV